jgi:2,4-diketo-3-deoxy-L-fuconate hydrolase
VRYANYEYEDLARCGVIREGAVHPFPAAIPSLHEFIGLGGAAREAVETEAPIALERVRLLAPASPRKNVFCVGRNYLGHAEEIARARGTALKLPDAPTFFSKAPTAIADPGDALHFSSAVSLELDWEAELAVIVGRRCRDVPEEDALGVIFGYTCLNDITARDLQRTHLQWFKGKSLDDACPIGPWIVGADEIPDPQALHITLRVNGVEKQSGDTATMIFGVRAIVAWLSRGLTLEPGDVIATGTPDGVGFARTPPEFLKNGDVVEVEIDAIGTLRNTIALR